MEKVKRIFDKTNRKRANSRVPFTRMCVSSKNKGEKMKSQKTLKVLMVGRKK